VTQTTVVETTLSGLKLLGRGKVRDIYDVDGKLLLVASDRLSAFDVVMPDGIPGKGKVLTQISAFWFDMLSGIVPNHMLSIDVDTFPPPARVHAGTLRGRAMLCRKAKPFPVECVVRGYLSGSGWSEYQEKGEVCGIRLPQGLRESDRLPEPIFTPATKEEKGKHDENISFERMIQAVGKETAEKVRSIAVALYDKAAAYALSKGIIIADTKFELGETVTPSPHHPIGAKGVGESPTVGSPAAYVNAVIDALRPLGVTNIDMPLTSAKVWAAIQEAKAASSA